MRQRPCAFYIGAVAHSAALRIEIFAVAGVREGHGWLGDQQSPDYSDECCFHCLPPWRL
jgi:hypothetical protein